MEDKKIIEHDKNDELETILEFLQRTKNGEYARVDPEHLKFVRIKAQTIIVDEPYEYGWR